MWPEAAGTGAPPGYRPLRISTGIRAGAAARGDRPALVSEDLSLSYAALVERMNRIANAGRQDWRLVPGDVVALIAPNRAEYVEIVAGLSDIGVIVATLNPRLAPAELGAILADCSPKLAIVDPNLDGLFEALRDNGMRAVTLGEDYECGLARASFRFDPVEFAEWRAFSICYTSGTTGAPKGVLLSHRSRALTFLAMAVEYGCFTADDHFLSLAPLCHGAGFAFAGAALSFGGVCELFNHSEPDRIVARIAERDVTGVFMVPTHVSRIVAAPSAVTAGLRGRHRLRSLISNAAPLSQALKQRLVEAFGEGLLHESYGSTEAGVVSNIRPADILRKPGSVGVPFIGTEIEIRRDDGSIAAPGEIGELWSRSAYTFSGYLNDTVATARTIRQGWVSVQDLAARDPDGYITICGRMKDMVISGGVNIYPAEIEAVIGRTPGVEDVAVVGLPDEEWGERLHAYVVLRAGCRPDQREILDNCRRELSGYKVPRSLEFIGELPRNTSGKVLKRELRERGSTGRADA